MSEGFDAATAWHNGDRRPIVFRACAGRRWRRGLSALIVVIWTGLTCVAQEVRLNEAARDPRILPSTNSLVLGAMDDRRLAKRNVALSELFAVDWDAFESPTLQVWDEWWKRRVRELEKGVIDRDEFEVIVEPWRSIPSSVPFDPPIGEKGSETGKQAVLPGDFVLLRQNGGYRLLVVAGKGEFVTGREKQPAKQAMFYYPFFTAGDKTLGCRQLQLNTFPPRVTHEIADVLLRAANKPTLSRNVFDAGWLRANVNPRAGLPLLRGCYLRLPAWQESGENAQYCVVRMKSSVFVSLAHAKKVEEDLRWAIYAARRAERYLLREVNDYRLFSWAFGVKTPQREHFERVASVYQAFSGHLIKAVIIETEVEREAFGHDPPVGDLKSNRLAFVKPGMRGVIYLDAGYFKTKPNRRPATLIHEFCHAWGMAGHPGTGDYGGQGELIRRHLNDQYGVIVERADSPHPMLSLRRLGKDEWFSQLAGDRYKVTGFLSWGDARANAYSYGYFVLWNHGTFWVRP